MSDVQHIRDQYERRRNLNEQTLYDPLLAANYMAFQERERALIKLIKKCGLAPLGRRRVLEVGCGTGGNLLQLQRLGVKPENMVGNELLEERAAIARQRLPAAIEILVGDACMLSLDDEQFDIVLQSTVFSSILDDGFQRRLARLMWRMVRPGGGILWYDFIVNNPRNPDVRGMPLHRIRQLFPQGELTSWRVTLAPPVSRRVAALHPSLYTLFNLCPLLRTHVLCWIRKNN